MKKYILHVNGGSVTEQLIWEGDLNDLFIKLPAKDRKHDSTLARFRYSGADQANFFELPSGDLVSVSSVFRIERIA